MTAKSKPFIRRQLLEMDRLAEAAKGDVLTTFALHKRRESLARELAEAPPEPPTPRTVLFFAGPPVQGNQGIDAKFATDVLGPFLEMVKTQYSAQKHGRVGTRGPRKDESEVRLLLTGLPRGSFGLELSQPQAGDFVSANQLSDALLRLTEVIASASDTDERFGLSLEAVSPCVLPRLKEFLTVVAGNQAYLGLESGDIKVKIPADRVAVALERVGAAETSEHEIEASGVFRGATLDSGRFDFRLEDGTVISGRIANEMDESLVEKMVQSTGKQCVATLRETTVTTSDGASRKRFELLSLIEQPAH